MGLPVEGLSQVDHSNDLKSDLDEVHSVAVPLHPLGIKPAGNAYYASHNVKFATGSFALLPDELLIQILEYLDGVTLQRVASTCKALYGFAQLDELWKILCIESFSELGSWRGSWRSTYTGLDQTQSARISCKNLFSDVLYRPFLCSFTSLTPYINDIPARNTIAKLSNLSPAEFAQTLTDLPFILTEPIRSWPVYQKWSSTSLLKQYGKIKFRAEAVDWPLKTYVDYMRDNNDESPLYLFDRAFVEKMDLSVGKDGGYWAPECFGEDLFAVLGDQRPDSRWLIIGPERSGSTFHKDPNATSAWNAVLKGSKYWIMFPTSPSQPPPPGVFVSEDQSEVTSPLSIPEWLLGFHAEARKTPGCREGICNEGEVLHVPSGWWHLVVNLEPSIAITQNFVPEAHLANVLEFLAHKFDQVSGFRRDIENPYELFVEKMQEAHPGLLENGLNDIVRQDQNQQGKKRKWELLVKSDYEDQIQAETFSFGFGGDEEEKVP